MNKSQSGLSMIELLVALAISGVLVIGATTLYVRSRNTYDQNEATARLQETARYAMSIMEPDIRAADYWGLLKGGWLLQGKATSPAVGVSAQAAAATPAAIAANAEALICGNNFATDVDTPVQGDNNRYQLSATRNAGCDALPISAGTAGTWTTTAVTTADTLTIRRAAVCNPDPNSDGSVADSTCPALQVGRLQVCSRQNGGFLASDGATACTAWPAGQLSNVSVTTYYVDQNSAQAGQPALRRKVLTSAGGVVQFEDQEIISGIEDFQVQFGIQPNFAGSPMTGTATATRYVNPEDPALAGAQIVAIRFWLLVRADTPDGGFADTRVYEYGDRLQATGVTADLNGATAGLAFQPSANGDASFNALQRYRRLLITRTIALRNAMGT